MSTDGVVECREGETYWRHYADGWKSGPHAEPMVGAVPPDAAPLSREEYEALKARTESAGLVVYELWREGLRGVEVIGNLGLVARKLDVARLRFRATGRATVLVLPDRAAG